jgi:hypothetical protein
MYDTIFKIKKETYYHEKVTQVRAALKYVLSVSVDEHAKLKTKLKTKWSSQPRSTSPTCVSTSMSRVTWGPTQVSWIPDESHKRSHKESHKDNKSEGSHKVRGIPQTYRM